MSLHSIWGRDKGSGNQGAPQTAEGFGGNAGGPCEFPADGQRFAPGRNSLSGITQKQLGETRPTNQESRLRISAQLKMRRRDARTPEIWPRS